MIILDTNVVSEAMRPAPDPAVVDWLNRQAAATLHLSSVSLAELLFGIESHPPGARRDRLTRLLDGFLDAIDGRVLPFDRAAAHRYAGSAAGRRAGGHPLPVLDGHIAAIAAVHGFAVATRNTADFQDTGIELIDPWQSA